MAHLKPISHWMNDSSTGEWLQEMRAIEADTVFDEAADRLERFIELRRTRERLRDAVRQSEAETIRLQRELVDCCTELTLLAAQQHVVGGVK